MLGPALLRRCRPLLAAALLALAALPASAHAITSSTQTVGVLANELTPPCVSNHADYAFLDADPVSAMPQGGLVTELRFFGQNWGNPTDLKILRPTGGDTFTVVGSSGAFTDDAVGLRTFTVNIPVKAGDVLGLWYAPPAGNHSQWINALAASCGANPFAAGSLHSRGAAGQADPAANATVTLPERYDWRSNVAATLTPDITAPFLTVTQLPSAPPSGQDGYFNAADLTANSGHVELKLRASDDIGKTGVDDLECTGGTIADEVGSDPRTGHVDLSADGTHVVACTATDGAGNTSSPTTTTVKIDATRPVVSVSTSPATGSGFNSYFNASDPAVVGTVSATDSSGSGLAGAPTCTIDNQAVTVDADGHFPISGDGAHNVICEATDKAGNTGENADPVSVNIDRTKPTASLTPDRSSPSNQDVTLDLSASDEGSSGLASRNCTDNSSPVSLVSAHLITVSSEGSHNVSCTVGDNAGNTTTATKTVVIDKTKPTISLSISPANGSGPDGWFNASDPAVTGATSAGDTDGSGVDSLSCTIGGSAATLDSQAHFAISGDGTHTVTCTATDKAGNSDATTITVKIDRTPPSVDVPANIVTAATSPQGAVVSWGAAAAIAAPASPCSPASGSLFPIGTTTVTCSATDQAGNTASKTFTVTVKAGAEMLDDLVAQYRNGWAGYLVASARHVYGLYPPMVCPVLQQARTLAPLLPIFDRFTAQQTAQFIDAIKALQGALGCDAPRAAQPNRTPTVSVASKARAKRTVNRVKAKVKKAKKRAARKHRHR